MTNDAGIYFSSAKKFKSDIMFASLMHYGKIRKLPAATERKKKQTQVRGWIIFRAQN